MVTCTNAQGNCFGITANSFSSVSLDPPLVLWNIAKVSNSLQEFLDAEHFGINILSASQKNESQTFAKSEHNIFDGVAYSLGENSIPLLDNTLAHLLCHTHDVHECGDHYIIVGEVTGYASVDADPLVFFNGAYQSLL